MSKHQHTRFALGTYRVAGDNDTLELMVRQAFDVGVQLVDTATMYGNDAQIAKVARELKMPVGSKVKRLRHVAEDLARAEGLFGDLLQRVLLHRPMPLHAWAILEDAFDRGAVKEIGVCNYSEAQLQDLLQNCRTKPHVVQNELHPAIATPVLALCRQHGIRFEAHSVLSANKLIEDLVLPQLGGALGLTASQLAIAHTLHRGADVVCVRASKFDHLAEDLAAVRVAEEAVGSGRALAEAFDILNMLPLTHPICRYGTQGGMTTHTSEQELDRIAKQLQQDIDAFTYSQGSTISKMSLIVPKTYRKGLPKDINNQGVMLSPANAVAIAHIIFGMNPGALSKFDHRMSLLRKYVQDTQMTKKASMYCTRLAVEVPDALPVSVPPGSKFEPFLKHLNSTTEPASRLFTSGAMFADGRMDLCKQVIRPRFPDLCKAVQAAPDGIVKHFLIGNNIAFRKADHNQDPTNPIQASPQPTDDNLSANMRNIALGGAVEAALLEQCKTDRDEDENVGALVELLRSNPKIETWYLAGNGIDAATSQPIAEAMHGCEHIDSVWLKMNPIKTGAVHWGRLIAANESISLLDLFNTGLCDGGIQGLAEGLGEGPHLHMKHLYLNINALSPAAVPFLIRIAKALPNLESLFIGENSLGVEGLRHFLQSTSLQHLKRMEMGSLNLSDEALPDIIKFAERHSESLRSIELGSYKSTKYFGLKGNNFTSEALLSQLAALPSLSFLGLHKAIPSSTEVAAKIVSSARPHVSVHAVQPGSHRDSEHCYEVLRVDKDALRSIRQPPQIAHIQSIYRNNM